MKIRGNKGFSMIEAMMGICLFTIALFGMLGLIGESMSFGKISNDQIIAINEAKRVMENVRRVADASGLVTVASTNFNETLNSNTLKNGTISVTDLSGNSLTNNSDPLPVRVTVSWAEKERTMNYVLDTMVTQR